MADVESLFPFLDVRTIHMERMIGTRGCRGGELVYILVIGGLSAFGENRFVRCGAASCLFLFSAWHLGIADHSRIVIDKYLLHSYSYWTLMPILMLSFLTLTMT